MVTTRSSLPPHGAGETMSPFVQFATFQAWSRWPLHCDQTAIAAKHIAAERIVGTRLKTSGAPCPAWVDFDLLIARKAGVLTAS